MQFKDHKPIFLQIAELISDEILGGKYPEGERLPSVREYAAEVEVNVNTVVRSFEWLSQKDIIFNKRGIGYFVADDARAKVLETQKEDFLTREVPVIKRKMDLLGLDAKIFM